METVSSVTDQCVISLSLLANIDPDAHYASQSANWMGRTSWGAIISSSMPDLFNSEATLPIVACQMNCLMAASQQYEQSSQRYEQSSQQYEAYCTEKKLDELFLEASQLLDVHATIQSFIIKPLGKQQVDVEPLDNPVVEKAIGQTSILSASKRKDIQVLRSHAYRRRRYKTGTECMGSKRLA